MARGANRNRDPVGQQQDGQEDRLIETEVASSVQTTVFTEMAETFAGNLRADFDTAIHDASQMLSQQMAVILKPYAETNLQASETVAKQTDRLLGYLTEKLGPVTSVRSSIVRDRNVNQQNQENPLRYGQVHILSRTNGADVQADGSGIARQVVQPLEPPNVQHPTSANVPQGQPVGQMPSSPIGPTFGGHVFPRNDTSTNVASTSQFGQPSMPNQQNFGYPMSGVMPNQQFMGMSNFPNTHPGQSNYSGIFGPNGGLNGYGARFPQYFGNSFVPNPIGNEVPPTSNAIPPYPVGYPPMGNQNPIGITREEVMQLVREQMTGGFRPNTRQTYGKPYPEYIDRIFEFPRGYKFPEFTLFSGDDRQTTLEHIGRFTTQCGEAAVNDFLKLRLFSNSLTGSAFTWYVNLSPGSIQTWQEMERVFHMQFYTATPEITVADLARLTQDSGEHVAAYILRFKRAKTRCHAQLAEADYVKLAQSGLRFELRKQFVGQEFIDLCHLVSSVARYEQVLEEEAQRKSSSKGTYYRSQNKYVAQIETLEDDEENEVSLAELATNKPYFCKALSRPRPDQKVETGRSQNRFGKDDRKYDFDISKTEQIFDILLRDKQIKLPEGHSIPSPDEIKNQKYCKWHHSWTHNTNNCILLRNVVQRAIEEGRLKFPGQDKGVHLVDEDPFPADMTVNMIEADLSRLSGNRMNLNSKDNTCAVGKIRPAISAKKSEEGIFFDYNHPEMSQYMNADFMQNYCMVSGAPILCMRCARVLAVPQAPKAMSTIIKGKGKEVVAHEKFMPNPKVTIKDLARKAVSTVKPHRLPPGGLRITIPDLRDTLSRPNSRFSAGESSVIPKARMVKPPNGPVNRWMQVRHPNNPQYHDSPFLTRSQKRRFQRQQLEARRREMGLEVRPRRRKMKGFVPNSSEAFDSGHQELFSQSNLSTKDVGKATSEEKVHIQFGTIGLTDPCLENNEVSHPEKLSSVIIDSVGISNKEYSANQNSDDDLPNPEDDEEMLDYSSDDFGSRIESLWKPSINMVCILPHGFEATEDHQVCLEDDIQDETDGFLSFEQNNVVIAEVDSKPPGEVSNEMQSVPFETPTRAMAQHLKPLYIKAHFNGHPVTRVLVDNGAAINVMPTSTMRRLGKKEEDLMEADVSVVDFVGRSKKPKGVLPIDVTVGKTTAIATGFFVMDAKVNYNALLGRDWIHANLCVPSSLHQCLFMWIGDELEVIKADNRPYLVSAGAVEAKFYSMPIAPIRFSGNDKNGRPTKVVALLDGGSHVPCISSVSETDEENSVSNE